MQNSVPAEIKEAQSKARALVANIAFTENERIIILAEMYGNIERDCKTIISHIYRISNLIPTVIKIGKMIVVFVQWKRIVLSRLN